VLGLFSLCGQTPRNPLASAKFKIVQLLIACIDLDQNGHVLGGQGGGKQRLGINQSYVIFRNLLLTRRSLFGATWSLSYIAARIQGTMCRDLPSIMRRCLTTALRGGDVRALPSRSPGQSCYRPCSRCERCAVLPLVPAERAVRRASKAPSMGRIPKRKTNFLQIIIFALQRAAGPCRGASSGHFLRAAVAASGRYANQVLGQNQHRVKTSRFLLPLGSFASQDDTSFSVDWEGFLGLTCDSGRARIFDLEPMCPLTPIGLPGRRRAATAGDHQSHTGCPRAA
jgi:hypothetical protein